MSQEEIVLPFKFRETDSIGMLSKIGQNIGIATLRSTYAYVKENPVTGIWDEIFNNLNPTVETSITIPCIGGSAVYRTELRMVISFESTNEPIESLAQQVFVESFIKLANLYKNQLNY